MRLCSSRRGRLITCQCLPAPSPADDQQQLQAFSSRYELAHNIRFPTALAAHVAHVGTVFSAQPFALLNLVVHPCITWAWICAASNEKLVDMIQLTLAIIAKDWSFGSVWQIII